MIGSVRRSRRAASRFFDDELDGAGSPKSIMSMLYLLFHERLLLHLYVFSASSYGDYLQLVLSSEILVCLP